MIRTSIKVAKPVCGGGVKNLTDPKVALEIVRAHLRKMIEVQMQNGGS